MACQGTYLGGCCNQPVIRDEYVTKERVQTGFISADRSQLQQLYQIAEVTQTWNFTSDGQTYAGEYRFISTFPVGGSLPQTTFFGTPFPDTLPNTLAVTAGGVITSIDPTLMVATIEGRVEGEIGNRSLGTLTVALSGALTAAHISAVADVLAYDPVTGANPGAAVITPIFVTIPEAATDGGTFRPVATAFRPLLVGQVVAVQFSPSYSTVRARARRVILSPRPIEQVRLRSYTRNEFDNTPIVYDDCSAFLLDQGVDIAPPALPDGKVSAAIEISLWPLAGPNPC